MPIIGVFTAKLHQWAGKWVDRKHSNCTCKKIVDDNTPLCDIVYSYCISARRYNTHSRFSSIHNCNSSSSEYANGSQLFNYDMSHTRVYSHCDSSKQGSNTFVHSTHLNGKQKLSTDCDSRKHFQERKSDSTHL